jgi:hypothetical protein
MPHAGAPPTDRQFRAGAFLTMTYARSHPNPWLLA